MNLGKKNAIKSHLFNLPFLKQKHLHTIVFATLFFTDSTECFSFTFKYHVIKTWFSNSWPWGHIACFQVIIDPTGFLNHWQILHTLKSFEVVHTFSEIFSLISCTFVKHLFKTMMTRLILNHQIYYIKKPLLIIVQ